MATVKIKFMKDAKSLWEYIYEGREPDDPMSFHNCTEGYVAELFLATQDMLNKRGVNQAIHIIQSWDEEESKITPPEKLNEIGEELCKRAFPGYDFAVVTHTDTGKTHNHIMLNPVHGETGKRIGNKKEHLYQLRYENDRLARENNLSVIVNHSRERWDKMSDQVRAINNRIGFSRQEDLKEKLKFAMSISTSFDEYSAYLNRGLGIKTKIRGTTISYVYPGMSRGRKASKLGARYGFEKLTEKFKENDWKLHSLGFKELSEIKSKDYRAFHKFPRGEKEYVVPEVKLKNTLIDLKELESLRSKSIEQYCNEHSITVLDSKDGYKRISGREYIRLVDGVWENEKNNTKGSLIEFIANYRRSDFLTAIGEGTKNEDYKKIAEALEVPSPSFRAYYVPEKNESLEEKKTIYALSKVDKFNRELLIELSKAGQATFYDKNRFKLFPASTRRKSLTYYRNPNSSWFTKRTKGLSDNLINKKGKANELILFDSAESFLRSQTMNQILRANEIPYNVVVPLAPLREWVRDREDFLSSFEKVRIVRDPNKNVFDEILSFKNEKSKSESQLMSISELDEFIKRSYLSKERGISR